MSTWSNSSQTFVRPCCLRPSYNPTPEQTRQQNIGSSVGFMRFPQPVMRVLIDWNHSNVRAPAIRRVMQHNTTWHANIWNKYSFKAAQRIVCGIWVTLMSNCYKVYCAWFHLPWNYCFSKVQLTYSQQNKMNLYG